MIEFRNVSFTYKNSERESGVYDLDFKIPDGQVVMFCGKSGCGKTTITRLINKLAPEYYEGNLKGEVAINGKSTMTIPLYELSKVVGSVFQNPRSQFFNIDSTSEIAFGCENFGMPKEKIYKRIGEVVNELKIKKLLDKNLFKLSGGEKQKIACASVSAMRPEVFVLDEPSSNLDIEAISQLRESINYWKTIGKTVVIAEHRLYYLMNIVDRIIYMENGRIKEDFKAENFKKLSKIQLENMGLRSLFPFDFTPLPVFLNSNNAVITIQDLSFSYDKKSFLNISELSIPKGAIVGILGKNGAGKTTFAKCLCGIEKSSKGILHIDGKSYSTKQRIKKCYMVMQDVNHQLFTESVIDEILLSMDESEKDNRTNAEKILNALNLWHLKELHPMSLSGGQKQRIAIGSAIASQKDVILFDEPTSGLDFHHMLEVSKNLKKLGTMGKTLFIITHDPELIVRCCNYFIYIENGKVLWSGSWTKENNKKIQEFFSKGILKE